MAQETTALIEAFLEAKRADGASKHMLKGYQAALRHFATWLANRVVDRAALRGYRGHLDQQTRLRPTTVELYWGYVGTFCAWLVDTGVAPPAPAELRLPHRVPETGTAIIPYNALVAQRQLELAVPTLHLVMPAPPLPLEAYISSYVVSLQSRGNRPSGVRRYRDQMLYFFRWLGPDATMDSITTDSIRRYQEEHAQRLNPATVSNALTCIRSFCRWAQKRKLRTDDPTVDLDWPKKRRPAPRALKFAELRGLMLAITNEPARLGPVARWTWQRNRRAILLMLFAGLRISEAAGLRWRDVDLEAGELWVRDGKGGKDRCIPLHRVLQYELELVPESERGADSGVVGNGRDGSCMSKKSMDHMFRRWLPKLGISISAHRLRASFATEMLRHDADLLTISTLLGHADLSTTQHYLVADTKRMRAAVDKLPSTW